MSHGIVRLAATRAILRSGVVDYLVIDDELAHALLVDSPMLVETTGSPAECGSRYEVVRGHHGAEWPATTK